jgi:dsDNA-specific endonuclease/ATPase MutS2
MSSVVNDPNAPHHRRSREEVEALAKNFVATPANDDTGPAKPKTMVMAAAAGAVVIVGLIAWIAWPSSGGESARAGNQELSRASAEVEALRQRMEAERERQRKELEAGKEYMERIAAADAAQMKDLAAQVDRLTQRVAQISASAPASDQAPTPREETRAAAAPAKQAPATTTASASPAPATTAAPAPQKSAPAPAQQQAAPAQAEPTQVAQAPASDCKIHVSELSSSGKLTYESIKKMKGARVDESTGHVFTPPVPAAGGRTVTFEVMPDGCVRVARR